VFDLTQRETLDAAGRWLDELKRQCKQDMTVVLFGNKQDLADQRQVSYAEANERASAWGVPYFEISCKTRYGVAEALLAFYSDLFSWYIEGNPKVVFLGDSGVGKSTLSALLKSGSIDLPDPARLVPFKPRAQQRRAPTSEPLRQAGPVKRSHCMI
jgi:GTPase SAR1 family protein